MSSKTSKPNLYQDDEYEPDHDHIDPPSSSSTTTERARLIDSTYRFFLRLPFFRTTPSSVLRSLAEVALHYTTARDEVILQQGAPCDDGLFFIKSGQFKVVKELPIYAPTNKAIQEFQLPILSPRGLEAQQQQQEASGFHTQVTVEPSPYSSQTSIQSTATFLTNEQHRTQQQRERDRDRDQHQQPTFGRHQPHRKQPSNQTLQESPSMTAIHEYSNQPLQSSSKSMQRDTSASSLQGYSELASYTGDDAPQPTQSSLAPAISPRKSRAPLLIGSRFLELTVLGPNAAFGEVGVMLQCPRTCSVISLSSGAKLVAITKFDFLRMNTRKTLNVIRQMAMSYRTNEELLYELDDTQQWEQYKRHLLDLSRDKTNKAASKLQQMPVFESVPINPFALRLPLLRGVQSDTARKVRKSNAPPAVSSPRSTFSHPSAAAGSQRSTNSNSASKPSHSPSSSISSLTSPSPPGRHARRISTYSNGTDLNIIERFSPRKVVQQPTKGAKMQK